jgi:hypothetical protein
MAMVFYGNLELFWASRGDVHLCWTRVCHVAPPVPVQLDVSVAAFSIVLASQQVVEGWSIPAATVLVAAW